MTENKATRDYYRGLLSIRKEHPVFRLATTAQVKKSLKFLPTLNSVIAYSLDGKSAKDKWGSVVVIHNADPKALDVKLPKAGKWRIVVEGNVAGTKTLRTLSSSASVTVAAQSTTVLYLP